MRIVCTGCGHLTETTNVAELGQAHSNCPFGPGEWAPFPELPPRLLGDLAAQELPGASLPEVLQFFNDVLVAVDETWFESRRADADQVLVSVRDAIATRLSWGGQSYVADRA